MPPPSRPLAYAAPIGRAPGDDEEGEDEEECCVICAEGLGGTAAGAGPMLVYRVTGETMRFSLACGHAELFHAGCLVEWASVAPGAQPCCPVCTLPVARHPPQLAAGEGRDGGPAPGEDGRAEAPAPRGWAQPRRGGRPEEAARAWFTAASIHFAVCLILTVAIVSAGALTAVWLLL